MNFKRLDWDSEFFGKRIGKLSIETSFDDEWVISFLEEKKDDYDMIYIFSNHDISLLKDIQNCNLADRKVIYTCNVKPIENQIDAISIYDDGIPNQELINLSIESAKYSRYKTDEHFKPDDYKRLYIRWIENSANGSFADFVLCYHLGKEIKGMITLKIDENIGTIGLIAVDTDCQGKGIGTSLINKAQQLLQERGIKTLDVATQMANEQACRFYEKQGMKMKSITYVYHWWSKSE